MLVPSGAEGKNLIWRAALVGLAKAGQGFLPLLCVAVDLSGKFGLQNIFFTFIFYFKLDPSSGCLLEDLPASSSGAQHCGAGGTAQLPEQGSSASSR